MSYQRINIYTKKKIWLSFQYDILYEGRIAQTDKYLDQQFS